MIQPKIQEVYIPNKDEYNEDFSRHILCDNQGSYIENLDSIKLITFTIEEFEQFKREFGKELLEKAAENARAEHVYCYEQRTGEIEVDKESITSVLDDYLLNNKL